VGYITKQKTVRTRDKYSVLVFDAVPALPADFKKYFEAFGRVNSAEVMFNRETNKSRGFGFVVFETESSVDRVLQTAAARQHSIDGKAVRGNCALVLLASKRCYVSSSICFRWKLNVQYLGLTFLQVVAAVPP
jgi:hypothetical protein